jgi:hypothetical protein
LQLEALETRCLLSSAPPLNNVLSQAAPLTLAWSAPGVLPSTAHTAVAGAVGSGTAASADVSWYTFSLSQAASVTLTSVAQQGTVLGLYNTDSPWGDYYDPLGHRLLAQADGTPGGGASLTLPLAPETYYVAVSGLGDSYFNPFIADSGYPGSSGPFQLSVNATALPAAASGLPSVLAAEAAPNPATPGVFTSTPLEIYLPLSGPLDPSVAGDLKVRLTAGLSGGGANLLATYNYSTVADELQLLPGAPLAPGTYEIEVSVSTFGGLPALAQSFSYTFQVSGPAAPDNTPATAQPLTFSAAGFAQVAGAIGDNPYSAVPFDPNQVDAYQFQITSPGQYALTAEAFAGRIGSSLNPALSLYVAVNGRLELVATNDDSFNDTAAVAASPVLTPLATDPVLYAALAPGDYYLVVSGSGNNPDPFQGPIAFTPNANLGQTFLQGGFTTGPYVLNVSLRQDSVPPQVIAVTPVTTGPAGSAPTSFVVQFSEAVNLQQLAAASGSGQLGAVTVVSADGKSTYQIEFVSYDPTTYQATFAMLQALPVGSYYLELFGVSPAGGITDLAGNPLVGGNDPAVSPGAYVVPFAVTGPPPGTSFTEQSNSAQNPQSLGTLAAFQLQAGISLSGGFTSGEAADYYSFAVLQTRTYVLSLTDPSGNPLPPGTWVTLTDLTTGTSVPLFLQGVIGSAGSQVNTTGSILALVFLQTGHQYLLTVQSWAPGAAYTFALVDGTSAEPPPPLTVGPAPAIQLQLLGGGSPPAPAQTLALTPPPPVTVTRTDPVPAAAPVLPAATKEATFLVSTAGGSGGPDASLPAGPVLVSAVPADVVLGLAAGPQGATGPAPVLARPLQDALDRVFAQEPAGAGPDTPLGPEQSVGGADWQTEAYQAAGTVEPCPLANPSASLETGLWQWLAKQLASGLVPLRVPGSGRHEAAPQPAGGAHEETRLEDNLPLALALAMEPQWDLPPEGQSAAPTALALATMLAAGGVFRPDRETRGVRPARRPSR